MFPDHRYLAVVSAVSAPAPALELTWLVHAHGGGPALAHVRGTGTDGARGWMLSLRPRPPFLVYFDIRDRR